jgi:membrane protease YdiL (CAAX protease family)
MDSNVSPHQRNFILRIFLSGTEARLRAGWRLMLHTLLLVMIFSIMLLVSLFLPVSIDGASIDTSLAALSVELASILAATWLARRFLDRRSFASLGLEWSGQAWKDLMIGFSIPALLMGLVLTIELSVGWSNFESWAWQEFHPGAILPGLISGLVGFTLVGFSEEILSRGYHLQNLREGLNLGWGLLLSSAVFALLHAANPNSNWISTIGILLAGYFLAYGWIRTGQLWLSIGLHIGWNFFAGTVFGFSVSGFGTFRLINHHVTGPVIITGGDFGPEAGLIILPAMALGVLLIQRYTRKRFEAAG